MTKRDYINRGQSASSRRKKNSLRRKQNNLAFISPAAVATIFAILLISSLYFITYQKKEELEAIQENKTTSNNVLPKKPEERWRYIKELENRQPSSLLAQTEPKPFATSETKTINNNQLTDEQRQLLAQIQADMR